MRRRVLRRLIWIYTVCSGLSVRIHVVNTVIAIVVTLQGEIIAKSNQINENNKNGFIESALEQLFSMRNF